MVVLQCGYYGYHIHVSLCRYSFRLPMKQMANISIRIWALVKNPRFRPKNSDSYVIEVADSRSDFGFYNTGLVSKIQ